MNQMMQNFQTAIPNDFNKDALAVHSHETYHGVEASDITVVLSVRLHADNPWLLDRLAQFSDYYVPRPKTLLVDFGSSDEYAEKLNDLCKRASFEYIYVDDKDVFSLASARNHGVSCSTTDLVFLSDPDCIFVRDFFGRIAKLASNVRMKQYIDVLLMCSVYHLSESTTASIVETNDPEKISSELEYLGYHCVFEGFGRKADFVAPYSNIFLINKRLFEIAGGYDPSFRGHGSEDFEFFIRLSQFTNYLPLPDSVEVDEAGPLTSQFTSARRFRGFRVLSSMIGLPGLLHGLKTFHLNHPRAPESEWLSKNDWKREKMKSVLDRYAMNSKHLLEMDGLQREKNVICVCIHAEHWGYFIPLRALGYKIIPLFSDSVEKIEAAANMIAGGEVDALAIFNPYMDSHKKLRGLFYMAQEKGKTIVIERGALPNTIYYASDVAYNDPSYSEEDFAQFTATTEELADADAYASWLRTGEHTLEKNFSYEFTSRKYLPLKGVSRPICFIPLQLDQDMAVTMFLRGSQKYREFVESVDSVASANPDILFIAKPHPLSKTILEFRQPNVILADQSDNIHALIDLATMTVCYNSGVGLISIIHRCPTYTVGNAYYNRGGAGVVCESLADAVTRHRQNPYRPEDERVSRLVAWLKRHRYSSFTAIDDVREFADRRSHGYRRVVVDRIVLNGDSVDLGRAAAKHPFGERSFGLGVLGLSVQRGKDSSKATAVVKTESGDAHLAKAASNASHLSAKKANATDDAFPQRRLLFTVAIPLVRPFMKSRLFRKLKNQPDMFFRDSKSPITRRVGRALGFT